VPPWSDIGKTLIEAQLLHSETRGFSCPRRVPWTSRDWVFGEDTSASASSSPQRAPQQGTEPEHTPSVQEFQNFVSRFETVFGNEIIEETETLKRRLRNFGWSLTSGTWVNTDSVKTKINKLAKLTGLEQGGNQNVY